MREAGRKRSCRGDPASPFVQVPRIERGKREVRLTTVLRLIETFQISPNDLLLDL
jgi:hypothetical protein